MILPRILSFLFLTSYYCTGNRVKRVLNGVRVLGRKGPYDAVQYMVGIGTMHGVPFYTFGFHNALKETGIYGTINCGGALLTPAIVQTACHCVATFDLLFFPRHTRINHHWESVRVVYIGINDRFGEPFSMITRPPVKSVKFFTHKLCRKLPKDITQQAISHDFGYIKIDPAWASGQSEVPTENVKFAPTYTSEELSRIYRLFLRNPPVCLNLGYGVFEDQRPSDFIRAGWTHIINDLYCQDYTCVNLTETEIANHKSWVCTEDFPLHYQPIFKGDSGSPFTCNNVYFGVASGGLKQTMDHEERYIGTDGALIFAVYQNAFEHRRAFVEEIEKLSSESFVEIVLKVIRGLAGLRKGGITRGYSTSKLPVFMRLSQETAHESSSIQAPSGLVAVMMIALPFTLCHV